MKSNNIRRAPDQATVTFSLPKELLAKVDAEAKADGRTRSNFLVHLLRLEVEKEMESRRNDSGEGPRKPLFDARPQPEAHQGNNDNNDKLRKSR